MLRRCTTLIGVLSFALLMSAQFQAQQPPGAAGQGGGGGRGGGQPAGPIQSIEQRTAGMQKIDGYFPLYWDDRAGSMFLEIPRMDTEFLMATGLAAGLGSNDIGLDRGQGGGGRVLYFQRVGPKVLLVQPNQSFRSSSSNPLERRSVEDLVREIGAFGFTVAAEAGAHVLVDATDFFLRDAIGAARARCDRAPTASTGPGARSTCRNTKGFPKNTEVDDDTDLRQRRRRRTRRRWRRPGAGTRTDRRDWRRGGGGGGRRRRPLHRARSPASRPAPTP